MLLLPEGMAAGRVEFFPYFEGIIRPAAPQSLRDGGRLALELETVATAEGGVPAPPAGVLLLDGTAVEVGLQPLASEPAAGKVLSVAEVAPSAPPAGRSLLDRLRGGSGGESPPAASATGVGARAAGGGLREREHLEADDRENAWHEVQDQPTQQRTGDRQRAGSGADRR